MKTVCPENSCNGCMACVDICPKEAISIKDDIMYFNALIDESKCVNCNLCESVCPNNHLPAKYAPTSFMQGWALDEAVRKESSSGGVATAIANAFIEAGGVVCSCTFDSGEFIFDFAETAEDVSKFRGSKYVKSNPTGVYKKIARYLAEDRNVLFIGLPCQVAAIRNYFKKNKENLYVVDLICHGTPSPKLLDSYLREIKCDLSQCHNISFREKSNFHISINQHQVTHHRVVDHYTFAFLKGLIYTENCYQCKLADLSRVSDVTLGDSWGSQLSREEQDKGISLILCQTERGRDLLEKSALKTFPVDKDSAIENNHQLKAPTQKPAEREKFNKRFQKSHRVVKGISSAYPKFFLRQKVKTILSHFGILK